MKRSLGLVLLAVSLGLSAQPSRDDISSVRAELARMYSYLDFAFEANRFDDVLRVALPDAVVVRDSLKIPFAAMIEQMKQVLGSAGAVKQRTAITSLRVEGSKAVVSRTTDSSVTIGGRTRSGTDTSEDTWFRTAEGWRLESSVALGSAESASATPDGAAAAVIEDLNRYARPLDDLSTIALAIGDARVVALGEATHGTHEFFAAKARIVEYLARTKGFTVLAVEGNWPDALAVDRYIKAGDSAPRQTLAGLNNWPLFAREMWDLVETMRTANIRNPGRLTFTGFDIQSADAARERVIEFVRRTAPDRIAFVDECYQKVIGLGPRRSSPDSRAGDAAESAVRVVALIDRLRDALIASSSHAQWRDARQAAEIVYQATAYRMEGLSPGFRDEMMARNTRWLCDEAHAGEKVVVWAHNGHAMADPGAAFKPMGAWLREWLGDKYYSIGFSVAGGEVRAVGPNGLAAHVMPSAAKGTGDGVFAQASLPSFFLDIRTIPAASALKKWLSEPHAFYTVGARWNDSVLDANTAVFPIGKSFDGVIFFRQGRATIGL